MATGKCQPKYQILYVFKLKQCLLHPATMLKLLVLLFIIKPSFVTRINNGCNKSRIALVNSRSAGLYVL